MATKKIAVNLDLNQNEIQNVKFQVLATDVSTPAEGQFWYNSTSNTVKFYDGATVKVLADLSAVEGLLDFKGGYDAATNTPDLDASPSGVTKGDMYVVTAAGNFFTEAVSVGDTLFSKIDSASTLADWVIVERNLNPATETTEGIIALATQGETTTGTNDTKAITPLKLRTEINAQLSSVVSKYTQTGVSIGATPTAQVITHNLGSEAVVVSVYDQTTKEEYIVDVEHTSTNTITIDANGATKTVNVVVVG